MTLLFNSFVMADVTAPDRLEINGNDTEGINGDWYGTGIDLTMKKTIDGQTVYCLDSDKQTPQGDMIFEFEKRGELSTEHAYVLANGYPNKSITGDNTKDYYITAIAIWYLQDPNDWNIGSFDFENGTFSGVKNDIAMEAGKLIKDAKNYSYVKPTVKVNISNNLLTLSSDNLYYVSSNIGINTTGIVGNYKVSLDNAPEGAIITDVNGNQKNEFTPSEMFVVKVPVSSINSLNGQIKVNITATGSIYKAYAYKCLYSVDSGTHESIFQDIAALYPEDEILKASTDLGIDFVTEVQVSKVDITDGKELAGATLTIKDSEGNVVESWVSTDEVYVVKGLDPGKYTLTEEIAPEGYILSTETVEFEVKKDGNVIKFTMKNEPNVVNISKIDITNDKELAGATLTIKDSEGNIVETWVSTEEVHVIKRLKPGKYTLTEEIAPEGYELSDTTISFSIDEAGNVYVDEKVVSNKLIVFGNTPLPEQVPTGSILIYVASGLGLASLAAVVFLVIRKRRINKI